jgi:hypothetical protein
LDALFSVWFDPSQEFVAAESGNPDGKNGLQSIGQSKIK